VRVCEDHSEFISDSDSLDHIADGASDGSQDSVSLLLLKPHSEFEGAGFAGGFLEDINGDVLEASLEGTQLSFYFDLAGLDVDSNVLRDVEGLLSNDVLHLMWSQKY